MRLSSLSLQNLKPATIRGQRFRVLGGPSQCTGGLGGIRAAGPPKGKEPRGEVDEAGGSPPRRLLELYFVD